MWKYAHPTFFLPLSQRIMPFLWGVTFLALAGGLGGLFLAPPDYQQGISVRILYLHVPAAWVAMWAYGVMSLAALGVLVWRHPLAEAGLKSAAPIGAVFTALCLITGSLWGKPMWGTFWVWDARLTSVFILFLIYVGLIALWRILEAEGHAARPAAILTLVGAINLPIIKFSVEWWETLHQPASVFKMGGPTIAWVMLWPLLVMAFAYTCLFFCFYFLSIQNEILRRKLYRLSLNALEIDRGNCDV